jgi:hypothetical protein
LENNEKRSTDLICKEEIAMVMVTHNLSWNTTGAMIRRKENQVLVFKFNKFSRFKKEQSVTESTTMAKEK